MKKAYSRYGLLGIIAVAALSSAALFATMRPAIAQGDGNGNGLGVLSGPIELPNQPGQKYQINLALFARGRGSRPVRTAIDLYVNLMGPTGPETVRRTIVLPHVLEVSGKICRVSVVQNGDNLDLYLDDHLQEAQLLNGLPPGEPVIGYMMNTHSTVHEPGLIAMVGTVEVFDPNGHTISAYKSHELTGNVTLMK